MTIDVPKLPGEDFSIYDAMYAVPTDVGGGVVTLRLKNNSGSDFLNVSTPWKYYMLLDDPLHYVQDLNLGRLVCPFRPYPILGNNIRLQHRPFTFVTTTGGYNAGANLDIFGGTYATLEQAAGFKNISLLFFNALRHVEVFKTISTLPAVKNPLAMAWTTANTNSTKFWSLVLPGANFCFMTSCTTAFTGSILRYVIETAGGFQSHGNYRVGYSGATAPISTETWFFDNRQAFSNAVNTGTGWIISRSFPRGRWESIGSTGVLSVTITN